RAEAGIDVEEVLDAVAVEGIEVATLLEDRAQPDRRHAQLAQIVELRSYARDRAALPAMSAGFSPQIPAPVRAIDRLRARRRAIAPIEERARVLARVAEPVDQEE